MPTVPATPLGRTVVNSAWSDLLDPLHDLLALSFAGRPAKVVWEREKAAPTTAAPGTPAMRATGETEHYLVTPGSPLSEPVQTYSAGVEARRFNVRIDYLRQLGGDTEELALNRMARGMEEIAGILRANAHYGAASALKWHTGQVGQMDLNTTTDEDEEAGYRRATLLWSAVVTRQFT